MTSEDVGRTRTGNFWLELSQLLHNPAALGSPRPHLSHKTTVQGAEAGDLGPAGPHSSEFPSGICQGCQLLSSPVPSTRQTVLLSPSTVVRLGGEASSDLRAR